MEPHKNVNTEMLANVSFWKSYFAYIVLEGVKEKGSGPCRGMFKWAVALVHLQ